MLASFLYSRRERKRLAASEKFWRERALAREAEVRELTERLLAQNGVMTDRILEAVKLRGASVEIQSTVENTPQRRRENKDAEKDTFLLERKIELEKEAALAGQSIEDAHAYFELHKDEYLADYLRQFGFSN